jgi:hypothetical protein
VSAPAPTLITYRWECAVCQSSGLYTAPEDASGLEVARLGDLQHAAISPRCQNRGTAPPVAPDNPCKCGPKGHVITCPELHPYREKARLN